MHKKNPKKLALNRETLRMMQNPELKRAAGGLTDSCPDSCMSDPWSCYFASCDPGPSCYC